MNHVLLARIPPFGHATPPAGTPGILFIKIYAMDSCRIDSAVLVSYRTLASDALDDLAFAASHPLLETVSL